MIKVNLIARVGERKTVIVDVNTTIRTLLEENDVEYGRNAIYIDGNPAGRLDATFEEIGITDHCIISAVAKADNAVSVKLCGRAVVVTSDVEYSTWKKVIKYRPNAAKLYEENGDEKFAVKCGGSTGNISKYGIIFGEPTADMAEVTFIAGEGFDEESVRDFIRDELGSAILNLKKIEEGVASAAEEADKDIDAVMSCIEF